MNSEFNNKFSDKSNNKWLSDSSCRAAYFSLFIFIRFYIIVIESGKNNMTNTVNPRGAMLHFLTELSLTNTFNSVFFSNVIFVYF